MKQFIRFLLIFFISSFSASFCLSQSNNVIDNFGDHRLPGWYWGGNLTMKYSHETDNLENGYAEIFSLDSRIGANSFVGIIRKEQKIQIVQENIFSLMLQGTGTDLYASVQILYDRNADGKYDESTDARLESKSISLNFSGWKEIHLNISENEFKIVSRTKEDFSLLENEAFGVQISYQTGKDYQPAKVETGIALIAERPNKENKQETAKNETIDGESYFNMKNFPNPFNAETSITYTLKSAALVKITVYDRLGREVALLFEGQQSEGEHSVSFNAASLPSGIYFYRLKTLEQTEVKKMVLAK